MTAEFQKENKKEETNSEILASILKSDRSKSSSKKEKAITKVYSSHAQFKGLNS